MRRRSDGGSSSSITLSYKQKRPSKFGNVIGKILSESRESPSGTKSSDRYFIENGTRLFEALITSCRGNTNPIRMFSAKELMEATDDYAEGRFLGSGITQVHSGIHNGRPIAVKRGFPRFSSLHGSFDMFLNEVVSLSQVNHRNVVRLLGCCIESQDPILVYELVSRGTLYQHIHFADASHKIPWADRLRIALEVADALNYLHTALRTPIVHGNIQSSSILLDDCYTAKVGTFGFSELVPRQEKQAWKGSSGNGSNDNSNPGSDFGHYVTEKIDVYGFGIVLIELLTGKRPSKGDDEGTHTISLRHFISSIQENLLGSVLDKGILSEGNTKELMACAWIAIRSTTEDVEERPTMKELVQELRHIRG